jgi:hypothetical protein
VRRAFFAICAVLATAIAAPAGAQPKAQGSAAPAATSTAPALPPGHPQVSDGLPAGHPAVDDDDEEPAEPQPKAGARGVDPRFFNPPEGTAVDDPTLPPGVIVATIKDAQDKPIPRAPLTLGVLHSSVAKGDSRERFARETDETGSARFEGLSLGSGTTYRVSTTRGPATYAHPPFPLGDRVGKRVVVHAYETSAQLEDLPVAMQTVVYVSLREDAIQVEQLITVFNLGPVAWTPDLTISLPRGFKAFNKQEAMSDARAEEVSGTGIALRGTFPPGREELDFRYQIPLDDEARQAFKIELPGHTMQARVMAEASKTMGLEVSGFPPPQRTESREGKHLLVTERQATRAGGGVGALDVTLSGLPTPGPGRWAAVALAIMALGAGLFYVLQRGEGGSFDEDALHDLAEAREALLGEIVALERAHKVGEVGPKTYTRVRASLLDALARIVRMLEAARPKPPPPRPGQRRPKRRATEWSA